MTYSEFFIDMTLQSDLKVEAVKGHYLVSRPSTGAVSLFSPAEYLVFVCLRASEGRAPEQLIGQVMEHYGCREDQVKHFTTVFMKKLEQQGWMRTVREDIESPSLQFIYLSITTGCNLDCKYCYIGDGRRHADQRMPLNDALIILEKIKSLKPVPVLGVTGGEPFTHPEIFAILDAAEQRGIRFTLGSNATLLDGPAAARLKQYRFLNQIQVSIDGMTPEVHALTRGDTWHSVMIGLRHLIDYKVPFSLAPTLHSENLHEVDSIARYAQDNGGSYAPNHLRRFPHASCASDISLSPGALRNSIIRPLRDVKPVSDGRNQASVKNTEENASTPPARCRYVCGNALNTIDIDWNGDIYPCQLLREKEFIIGNILTEEIPVIMDRGRRSPTRVRAYDIPGCRECAFVATCAGGCRASGYYHRGAFAERDELCEILYQFEVDKLFYAKDPSGYIPPLAPTECGKANGS